MQGMTPVAGSRAWMRGNQRSAKHLAQCDPKALAMSPLCRKARPAIRQELLRVTLDSPVCQLTALTAQKRTVLPTNVLTAQKRTIRGPVQPPLRRLADISRSSGAAAECQERPAETVSTTTGRGLNQARPARLTVGGRDHWFIDDGNQ